MHIPLYSPVNVLYYRATSNRIAKKEVLPKKVSFRMITALYPLESGETSL